MADRKDITKRHTSFWNSDLPLMSERVRQIMSHPGGAEQLADAIRAVRRGDPEGAVLQLDEHNRIVAVGGERPAR
jgi:hypothetical protein